MKLRVEREAEEESIEAARKYEQTQTGLEVRFPLTFDRAAKSIARFPRSHSLFRRPRGRELRCRLLKPFDYLVVFEVRRTEVVILVVGHARRGPGYWRRRLSLTREEE